MLSFYIIIEGSYNTPLGEYGSPAVRWQLAGWVGRMGRRREEVCWMLVGVKGKQDARQECLCQDEKQNDGRIFILLDLTAWVDAGNTDAKNPFHDWDLNVFKCHVVRIL